MTDFLLRMSLPFNTGLPRDVAQSSFAMQATTLPEDPSGIQTAVNNFWNTNPGESAFAIADFLSPVVLRTANAATAEIFQITHPAETIGEPLFSWQFTIGAASDPGGLPNEVAICTSLLASGGTNARRNKGRMYIGPLNQAAVGADSGGQAPPAGELVATLVLATQQLALDVVTAGGTLCVWSREDHALHVVEGGWVDNAWDTQRRRGLDPTSRTSWTV